MGSSKLFEPLRVAGIDIDHRIAMAPLTRLRAGENHVPTPIMKEYYEQRASVPGTLLIAEATLISPTHGGYGHAPAIWNEEQTQAWRAIVDAVHAKGSSIICQLVAVGRVGDLKQIKKDGGHALFSSSAVAMTEDGYAPKDGPAAVPQAMTEQDISACVDDFVHAAKNAVAAGFDGVELHGANGYLIDQFLQDTCNQRTDAWGGSVENRCRFAINVASAVGKAIGVHRLGFRVSPWSKFQGMRMEDPVPTFKYLAEQLKAQGLGYLHIIEGRVNNNVDCESQDSIHFLLETWDNVTPVLIAGGNTPENVFEAADVKYGNWDVVFVFGRHFLANPDLPYRIKNGLPLNKYDRSTFYAVAEPKGYADYPFSEKFLLESRAA